MPAQPVAENTAAEAGIPGESIPAAAGIPGEGIPAAAGIPGEGIPAAGGIPGEGIPAVAGSPVAGSPGEGSPGEGATEWQQDSARSRARSLGRGRAPVHRPCQARRMQAGASERPERELGLASQLHVETVVAHIYP